MDLCTGYSLFLASPDLYNQMSKAAQARDHHNIFLHSLYAVVNKNKYLNFCMRNIYGGGSLENILFCLNIIINRKVVNSNKQDGSFFMTKSLNIFYTFMSIMFLYFQPKHSSIISNVY